MHRSGEGGWGAARADLTPGGGGLAGGRRWAVERLTDGGSGDGGGRWAVERLTGDARHIHAAGMPDRVTRLLRWCEPDGPALVLGSAQPDTDVDREGAAAAGLDVVRRHSGGSAVVVGPGRLVWLDVIIPADDPLWDDDVGVAPLWLGHCWVSALAALGVGSATVHAGPTIKGQWAEKVCFAGVGPGEVLAGGRKLVGISQRRTRAGALFQTALLLRWDPREAVAGLAVDPAAAHDLATVAVGLDELQPGHGRVEDALAGALMRDTTA